MTETAGTSTNDDHPYQELIQQFKEICAVDDALAAACIEQADGNLQNAVVRFLSGEGIPEPEQPPQEIPMAHHGIRRRTVNNAFYDNSSASSSVPSATSTPVNRTPPADNSWSAWFNRILTLPFHLFYYSVRQIFAFAFGLFGGFFPAITSPEEDVQTFRTEIETKYSDVECQLNWHHSTYADALKEAKTSVRFLLVYLHNPSHQTTEGFIREKLCTQDFKNFLEQNGIIIFGTNVRTNEGYKVAQALHEQNYPSLLLICMRDNRLACVQKLSGNHSKENLIAALEQGVSTNQRYLNAILNERAQRELNNRLRREQEEEYERALQEDRKKLQERRRLESEHLENQKREEDELKELEAKKQRLADIRERIRQEVESYQEPSENVVRVSVRFPCGSKFDRRFGATDSLEILFNTVIAHDKCPEDFSLLSSYPRKELPCAPDWYKEYATVPERTGKIPTFQEAGLDSSVSILVKDNQA